MSVTRAARVFALGAGIAVSVAIFAQSTQQQDPDFARLIKEDGEIAVPTDR